MISNIAIAQDVPTDSISLDNQVANNDPLIVNEKSNLRKNLRLGGAFNLSIVPYQMGNIPTQLFYAQISPQVTYVLGKYFEGGITTSYSYAGTFSDINSHSLSFGPILRAYLANQYFIQAEGLVFYNSEKIYNYPAYTSMSYNAFIGTGMYSKISENSYVLTGVKINLIPNRLTYNLNLPVAFTSFHFGF